MHWRQREGSHNQQLHGRIRIAINTELALITTIHWGRGTTVNGSVGEHYWYIRIIITYMNKLVEVPSFD